MLPCLNIVPRIIFGGQRDSEKYLPTLSQRCGRFSELRAVTPNPFYVCACVRACWILGLQVLLSVEGQSFLLNQIRKMVAMAADVARGNVTMEGLAKSFTAEKVLRQ